MHSRRLWILPFLIICGLLGCTAKHEPAPQQQPPAGSYFKTHWQDESQFIVEATLTDIAEMAYYAKNHKLPDPAALWVDAKEQGGAFRAPVYQVEVSFEKNKPTVKFELPVNEAIWSPNVYADATTRMFNVLNLPTIGSYTETDDGSVMSELVDAKATTLEEQNKLVSEKLQQDFSNPTAHEQAALVAVNFAGRESSGDFHDIRLPLTRVTAHLAVASVLAGVRERTPSGILAEALLNVCIGNATPAIQKVHGLRESDKTQAIWIRTVDALASYDYRPLEKLKDPTMLEHIAWYAAYAGSVDVNSAWEKLKAQDFQYPDFCRVANNSIYSVQVGHALLQYSLPLEFKEIDEVYKAARGQKLTKANYIQALNEMPESCFGTDKNGKPVVRVIGWGQWAMFFQRQLCHAVQQNYNFLRYKYGDRDEATKFSAGAMNQFAGLRLFPFMARFICEDEPAYKKSVDDGFAVTVATPHLVSAQAWNYICWPVKFAPQYSPNPNPHVNEWHKHNPPPGTVYNLYPRLWHPSLTSRPDAVSVFEQLHQLNPYSGSVSAELVKRKYKNKASYEELEQIYSAVLDYAPETIRRCATATANDPVRWEKLMVKAAALQPRFYGNLSRYFETRDETKAAEYGEKFFELDPDKVGVANESEWLMYYNLRKGNKKRAQEIAEFCGDVYSARGLSTLAGFYETTSNYTKAFETYVAREERYNEWGDVIFFIKRYQKATGDTSYDGEIKKRFNKLFPKGMEKVSLKDFTNPPTDGVLINQDNDLLRAAGLSKGDVIVATYGIRMHWLVQYFYIRDTKSTPLDMIVWKKDHYESVQADPPNHLFGADFRNYFVRGGQE
jgi:hypothetical protein